MLTTIHHNVLNLSDSWIAIVVLGNYEDKELCLPDIRVQLPYKAQDVVFIHFWDLKHFIHEF